MREPPSDHQRQHMQRNQVDEKDVATPAGDHVEVGQRTAGRPENRAGLYRFDP